MNIVALDGVMNRRFRYAGAIRRRTKLSRDADVPIWPVPRSFRCATHRYFYIITDGYRFI